MGETVNAEELGQDGIQRHKLFNQALLARQAWRLIQYLNSLCAQILKAKYYPNGELVDTVFHGDVSPTWKAIVHGLELVKKGIIWRIRAGAKVNIWRDPWIPRQPSFRISLRKGRSRIHMEWDD
jgi:hypothetical protein